MKVKGQTIAITGGASGIGFATAERIIADGGNVAVIDANAQAAEDAASRLDGGERALGLCADVTDAAAISTSLEAVVARFGRLDGLVASAGIRQSSVRVADMSAEVWERTLKVDLGGTFLTCQAAARIFGKAGSGGSIVTVASLSGHSPRVGQAAYCAAKAGVIALTKVLSLELAAQNVRVNCVCPGTTVTPFNSEALKREGEQGVQARIEGDTKQYRPGIPLRRLAEARDIAGSIAFLLSDDARHITGIELFIDGGESVF